MSNSNSSDSKDLSFGDFLASAPPGSKTRSLDAIGRDDQAEAVLAQPDVWADCESPLCDGFRNFHCVRSSYRNRLTTDQIHHVMLQYVCRNCRTSLKVFALLVDYEGPNKIEITKVGEFPSFGPRTPSRVVSLIGPDRELFLKGRRSESQGLGIGAFAYYRRVVENQWRHLLDEVIRVAKSISASPASVAMLEAAARDTQFSKAVDDVKDAIPAELLIRGHNPLKLLHSALSVGIHDLSDDECLTKATSVRLVLFELAERLGQALKDHATLGAAVTNLLQGKQKP